MTPRKPTIATPLTDRVTLENFKTPTGRWVTRGQRLSIDGIRGRCTFVAYTLHSNGKQWIDVLTATGAARTVRPEKIKAVHIGRTA